METDTFSREQIETIAGRAFDGERVQVLDYQLARFSKDKVGFLGTHQNLELTVKRDGKNEPEVHRFFVKSMPQLSEEQLRFIRERDVFGQEASYFNDMLPLLKKACPKTEDWCPKCLLANGDFVVLEDMRLRNYAMSSTKMLNEDQLRAAFKAQARLHAASLVAERRLGKPLNQVPGAEGRVEPLFSDAMIKHKRIELFVDLAEKVAGRLCLDPRRIDAGLRKGFYQMYDQSRLSTRLPKVLEHGDAWPNNYLFDASDPMKAVLVDFQMTRYGPPMYDSVLLAYLGTNREFRRRVVAKALEAYHGQLCEVLEKNDPEIKKPKLQDVLDEYEELRMTALFCSIMYYPIIWMDKSTLGKYSEEELYRNLMFRQENSYIMKIYDEDQLFAERINDVVKEAVEYYEQRGVPIEATNGSH